MVILILDHSFQLSSVDRKIFHVLETGVEAICDFLLEIYEHAVLHAPVLIEDCFKVFDPELNLVLLSNEDSTLLADVFHLFNEIFQLAS